MMRNVLKRIFQFWSSFFEMFSFRDMVDLALNIRSVECGHSS